MKLPDIKWYHWVLVAAGCVLVVVAVRFALWYFFIQDWPMNIGGKPN